MMRLRDLSTSVGVFKNLEVYGKGLDIKEGATRPCAFMLPDRWHFTVPLLMRTALTTAAQPLSPSGGCVVLRMCVTVRASICVAVVHGVIVCVLLASVKCTRGWSPQYRSSHARVAAPNASCVGKHGAQGFRKRQQPRTR